MVRGPLIRLALLISLILASANAAPTKIKLFVLSGQSNSVGMGQARELPDSLRNPFAKVKFYAAASLDDADYAPGVWEPLQPAFWCGHQDTNGVYSWCEAGPYLTFGHNMAAAMPNDSIAIFLFGRGNTTLAVDFLPPSAGGPGNYYSVLVNAAKQAITDMGSNYQVEIAGMLWMQGESDATDATWAAAYQTRLTQFIADVRKDLGAPRMPFVIAQIDSLPDWQYANILRPLQAATANSVDNAAWFDTDHYPVMGVHYNHDGIQVEGAAFAANMLRLLSSPAPGAFVQPSDLIAATLPNGNVKLTWRDNSSTETGFSIERMTGAGSYGVMATAPAGTAVLSSYTDQSTAASTLYTYRVKATNAASSTAYTNELAVYPTTTGSGLKAEYFKDTTLTTLAATRTDATVNFGWGTGSPITGITAGSKFSVRWSGSVVPRYTENYTFFLESDMMARIWVNNQQIVNQWTWNAYDIMSNAGDVSIHCGWIHLTAGQAYPIKVEYHTSRNSASGAFARLRWQTPVNQAIEIIPQSRLFADASSVVDSRGIGAQFGRPATSRSAAVGFPGRQASGVRVFDTRGRAVRRAGDPNSPAVRLRPAATGVYLVTRNNGGASLTDGLLSRVVVDGER